MWIETRLGKTCRSQILGWIFQFFTRGKKDSLQMIILSQSLMVIYNISKLYELKTSAALLNDIIKYSHLCQVYSLLLFFCAIVVYLSLEHYLSVEQDLSYALPVFLFSLSVSTFSLSFLACFCLVRQSSPAPLGYLVSNYRQQSEIQSNLCIK